MKKIVIFGLIISLFLVLAMHTAYAAASINVGDIHVGGDDVDKSNPDEDDEVYDEVTFTVTNNGDQILTGIGFSTNLANADYNVSFTPASITTLGVNDSTQVTMKVRIPEKTDAFFPKRNDPQEDRESEIGIITVSANEAQNTGKIYLETENKLKIYKLYVSIDDDEHKVDDGDEVENVEPGSTVEVRVVAENKYRSDDNIKIEDVEFRVEVDDGDMDEEESEDLGDIKEDDKKEETVSFEVDDDIDEDTYTMMVWLEGEDEYGSTQGEYWEIDLTVERENEKLDIARYELNPAVVQCGGQTILTVRVENNGADDADDSILLVENKPLKLYSRILEIEVDSEEEYSKTIPLTIPKDAAAGTYGIDISTFFDLKDLDNDKINQYASATLQVECATQTAPDKEDSKDTNDTTDDKKDDKIDVVTNNDQGTTATTVTDKPNVGEVKITPTKEGSSLTKGTYTALIILAYVFVVGLIIYLIASLLMKK